MNFFSLCNSTKLNGGGGFGVGDPYLGQFLSDWVVKKTGGISSKGTSLWVQSPKLAEPNYDFFFFFFFFFRRAHETAARPFLVGFASSEKTCPVL